MNEPTQAAEQWRGKFLRVVKCGRWEYADRVGCAGAVAIVAVTADNKLILTEQFRIPVNRRVIELPAGLSGDVPGQFSEAAVEAAKRELLEETGYAAETFIWLASGPPSAGLASETVDFFAATGLTRVSAGGGDAHEDIQVHEVPLNTIDAWLRQKLTEGVMVDPKIYAGLYLLEREFNPAPLRLPASPATAASL
jgi:ADP-ribose pyrophosphatase